MRLREITLYFIFSPGEWDKGTPAAAVLAALIPLRAGLQQPPRGRR